MCRCVSFECDRWFKPDVFRPATHFEFCLMVIVDYLEDQKQAELRWEAEKSIIEKGETERQRARPVKRPPAEKLEEVKGRLEGNVKESIPQDQNRRLKRIREEDQQGERIKMGNKRTRKGRGSPKGSLVAKSSKKTDEEKDLYKKREDRERQRRHRKRKNTRIGTVTRRKDTRHRKGKRKRKRNKRRRRKGRDRIISRNIR